MATKVPRGVGPGYPHVVVLAGATGDLSRRKLLPGLFHLVSAGFIPGCRIIGMSLDELSVDEFRAFARKALDEFGTRDVTDADWQAFADCLDYVSIDLDRSGISPSQHEEAFRISNEIAARDLGGSPEEYELLDGRVHRRGASGRGLNLAITQSL